MKNEIAVKEESGFLVAANEALDMGEEMQGLNLTFDRIKVPAGGGIAYEVPSDNPDEPDSKKEIKAVILHHHAVQTYYASEYSGASEPPDCSSYDGKHGISREDGVVTPCATCPKNQFGAGYKAKECKAKRRLFLLLEGNALPVILNVPTSSLKEFGKFITRIVGKRKKSFQFVTKFTLKKDQNAGGIVYSKVVASIDRELTDEELAGILPMVEQVKVMATKISNTED